MLYTPLMDLFGRAAKAKAEVLREQLDRVTEENRELRSQLLAMADNRAYRMTHPLTEEERAEKLKTIDRIRKRVANPNHTADMAVRAIAAANRVEMLPPPPKES